MSGLPLVLRRGGGNPTSTRDISMFERSPRHPRLRWSLSLAVLSVGYLGAYAVSQPEANAAVVSAVTADTTWLASVKAKHRQLFDAPAPGGGIPLIHVMNYYDTYNSVFGVTDKDIDGVLTFYGSTTFFGLDDSMWAKYKLGEFLNEKDGKGTPFTSNPWRTSPTIIGQSMPAASVESLQKRGATFILCNNALGIFAGMVAQQRGLQAGAVLADMKAHILPGVRLVPAMVIAIEQAQEAGIAYHRQ